MVEEIIKVDGKDYKINYEGSLTDIQRFSMIRKISSQQKNVVNVLYPGQAQIQIGQQGQQQTQLQSLSPGAHPSIPTGRTTGYVDTIFHPDDTVIICLFENKATMGYTQGVAKFQGSKHDIPGNICYQDITNATIGCINTTAYNLKGLARAHIKTQGLFNYGCLETFGCSSGDNCVADTCTTFGSRISFETSIIVVDYVGSLPAAPATLTVTPGNSQLTASWSSVTDTIMGGEVFAYRVIIYEAGWPVADGYLEGGVHTVTIGGLTNGTTYDVSVVGVSYAGVEGWDKVAPGTPVGATTPQIFNWCWKVGLPASGSCTIPPDQPAIAPGTLFKIKADLANNGPAGKVRAVFKAGTTVISDQNIASLGTYPGGGMWSPSVDYTMPGASFILTIEAYGWDGSAWVLNRTVSSTISPSAPNCTSVGLTPFSANVNAGTPVNFTATTTPSTATFTVTFKLRDGTVLGTRTTSGGIATFSWDTTGRSGTYYVSATVVGQCTSTESAINISVPLPTWTLDIYVKDSTNNTAIAGASVTILTQTLITDALGHVSFIVDQGTVNINITKTGYNNKSDVISVFNNATITELMVPVTPTTGSLRFITVPAAADVYFGTTLKGTTDITTGVLTIGSLNAGPIAYTVKKTGYNDATGTATVVGGITTDVPVTLTVITPTTGDLCMKSTPSGASIKIDNVLQVDKTTALSTGSCVAANTITGLSPGSHGYTLSLTGYDDKTGTFSITAGQTTITDAGALTPVVTTGTLTISSSPVGAMLYIDNVDTTRVTPATVLDIASGSHPYKLTLTGYQDKTGTFSITAGQTTDLGIINLTVIPPTTGSLDITSTPANAHIFVDNADTTRVTPAVVPNLITGSHTYKLTLTGYADKVGTFSITVGQTTTTDAGTLTPLTSTGDVHIISDPVGAEIYIDDVDRGYVTPATVPFLSPGSHTYKLTLTGYADKVGTFSITTGQTTNVDAGTLARGGGGGGAGMLFGAIAVVGLGIMMTSKPKIPRAPVREKISETVVFRPHRGEVK